ncbi:MAG: methyltransferase domain-containing protein, partial [Bacteroidetes bacterium]|nr:methyltransferase domain-containing protein [Bacteroidota bacterium]
MNERVRMIPMSNEAIERFRDILELTVEQTYPEPPSEPHHSISRIMIERVLTSCAIAKPGRVLDVGCGQGPALDLLRSEGYHAVGITINDEDIRVCRD